MSWPYDIICEVLSYFPIDDLSVVLSNMDTSFQQMVNCKLFYRKLLANNFNNLGDYDAFANMYQFTKYKPLLQQLYSPVIYYAIKNNNAKLLCNFVTQMLHKKWRVDDEIGGNLHRTVVEAICQYGNMHLYYQVDMLIGKYLPSGTSYDKLYSSAIVVAVRRRLTDVVTGFYPKLTYGDMEKFNVTIFYHAIDSGHCELAKELGKIGVGMKDDRDIIEYLFDTLILIGTDNDLDKLINFVKLTEQHGIGPSWRQIFKRMWQYYCGNPRNQELIRNASDWHLLSDPVRYDKYIHSHKCY